jgi:predicted nucleotidyltransferase
MLALTSFPGTSQHQALLRAIVSHYEKDARVRAVVVFGSLARGNWDAHSDIDCDIVVGDDVPINPSAEVRSLEKTFAEANERVAFAIPMDDDAVDIQFCSLMQLSMRWHALPVTSPNIVGDMTVLAGTLRHSAIAEAGTRNLKSDSSDPSEWVDVFVRYAVVANTCIQRNQAWATLDILHRMRIVLMDVFALTHGGERGYQFFDSNAPNVLLTKLAATLAAPTLASMCASLIALIQLVEEDLGLVSDHKVHLTEVHRLVLNGVRRELVAKGGGA